MYFLADYTRSFQLVGFSFYFLSASYLKVTSIQTKSSSHAAVIKSNRQVQ